MSLKNIEKQLEFFKQYGIYCNQNYLGKVVYMKFVKLTLSWIIFWTGIGLFSWSGWNLVTNYEGGIRVRINEWLNWQTVKNNPVETVWAVEDRIPIEVSFPRIDIEAAVVPNQIVDGEWQVAEFKANYLIGSGVVGKPGNVVIYAHKRPKLFGNLNKIGPGDTVITKTSEVVAEYMVVDSRIVKADAIEVLAESTLKELTLYTCNGWKDEDRLVVKALFVKEDMNGFAGLSGEQVPERGFGSLVNGKQ